MEVVMLVLSRAEGDGILVPDLDLAVRVLRIVGGKVRIGIEAPQQIRVIRAELQDRARSSNESADSQLSHAIRNQLNRINLSLTLAEKHLERGDLAQAQSMLESVLTELAVSADSPISPDGSTSGRPVNDVRVLLVEDNRSEGSLLAEVLRLSGLEVSVTGNGVEAIAELKQRPADVILLDMHMPECDGPETLRRIRNIPEFHHLPVYAVSGAAAREIDLPQGKTGIRHWFQKPVMTSELVATIRRECRSNPIEVAL
jgi:carbon storage regulator CsrA